MPPESTSKANPVLDALFRNRIAFGRTGKCFTGLGGMSTPNNLAVIRALMFELKPESTLEIGLAYGGSALTFAGCHRDLGRPPRGQHIAIDPYQSVGWDDIGRIKLEEAELSDYVDVRETLSALELPLLVREGKTIDMLYIDGSHRFEDVFCDFYYARFLLSINGLVLFDDSPDPQVRKTIQFIDKNLSEFFVRIATWNYRSPTFVNRAKYALGSLLKKQQLTVFKKIKDGERDGNAKLKDF